MKRSLLKLIEYSILPAVILILAKIGGIYLAAALFNINVDIMPSGDALMFFKSSVAGQDITVVSTYSDLFMYLGIALGMTIILVQALYLHDSHISPKMVNELAKRDLMSLIKSSFELYHSGVIWLAFLWLAAILVLINTTKGVTGVWALGVCLVFTISYSIIFLKDLFTEIELNKNDNTAKSQQN